MPTRIENSLNPNVTTKLKIKTIKRVLELTTLPSTLKFECYLARRQRYAHVGVTHQ
jgi:hypothetical protein